MRAIVICIILFTLPFTVLSASLTISISDPVPIVSDTIRLDFLVSEVNNLFGAGFDFVYDPYLLEYQGATEGSLLDNDGTSSTIFIVTNNTATGTILAGLTRSRQADGGVSITDPELLLSLIFTVLAADTIPLTITKSSLIAPDGITKYDHDVENGFLISKIPTDVTDDPTSLLVPSGIEVGECYPNPFNPVTRVDCSLSHPGQVRIDIFNLLGQRVTTLFEGTLEPGEHTFEWDTSMSKKQAVTSGMYFMRVESSGTIETRKMILVK